MKCKIFFSFLSACCAISDCSQQPHFGCQEICDGTTESEWGLQLVPIAVEIHV